METNIISASNTSINISRGSPNRPDTNETALFKEIRNKQKRLSGKAVELYGYYDGNYKLTVLGMHQLIQNGLETQYIDDDAFEYREGIVQFHAHPILKDVVDFMEDYNDFSKNLVDIPSNMDVMGFLCRECPEEVVITEHFTFKLMKTKDAHNNALKLMDELADTDKKKDMRDISLDGGILPPIFLLAYIDRFYPNTNYKALYGAYNSRTFIDVCKEIYNINVVIYDLHNKIINKEAISGHFKYRKLSAEEERNAINNQRQNELMNKLWKNDSLSNEEMNELKELCK